MTVRDLTAIRSTFALLGCGCLALPAQRGAPVPWPGGGEHLLEAQALAGICADVAAGDGHTILRRADGALVVLGDAGTNGHGHVPGLPPGLGWLQADAGGGLDAAVATGGGAAAWLRSGEPIELPQPPPPLRYVQIAAGSRHGLALRSDGTAVGFGADDLGQASAPGLPTGLRYVQVAAGDDFSVALRSDGSVLAWGEDGHGQRHVPPLPGGCRYVEIAAGNAHALARRSDGAVVAWGWNDFGQCTVPALPAGVKCVQLAAGGAHSLALGSDGRILAWGANYAGQLEVPALPPGVLYRRIDAGGAHGVALRSDGAVALWGSHRDHADRRDHPADRHVRVTGGGRQLLALRGDGGLEAWGEGAATAVPHGRFVEVAAGAAFALARRTDGGIVGWGDNSCGQLDVPTPPGGTGYASISAGERHGVAVRSDGAAVVWGGIRLLRLPPPGRRFVQVAAGAEVVGRLDDGTLLNLQRPHAVPPLPAGVRCVAVAAGRAHYLALRSDGVAIAWGEGGSGQRNVPACPPGVRYVEICAGADHCLARRSDGVVVAWGDNAAGQCDVPQAPAGVRYVQLAAGRAHSAALRSDGQVVAWGAAPAARRDGRSPPAQPAVPDASAAATAEASLTRVPRLPSPARRTAGIAIAWCGAERAHCDVPAPPPGLEYVQLAAGDRHVVALRSDGALVAWGGDERQCRAPAGQFAAIASGRSFALARRKDDAVVAWGDNGSGQLDVPPLPDGVSYEQLAAGDQYAAAVRSDGAVLAWGALRLQRLAPAGRRFVQVAAGSSLVARLDDGTILDLQRPFAVPPPPAGLRYVDLAAGRAHFLALRSDGAVIAWGDNSQGQANVPVRPAGVRYVEIEAGRDHSVALRSDGTLVAWGDGQTFEFDAAQLEPGTALAQICAGGGFTIALLGPRGLEVGGPGCPGSGGPTRLDARRAARVGETLVLDVQPPPPGAASMLLGFGAGALPGPPEPLVPGTPCALRVASQLALPVIGGAEARVRIPAIASLAGMRLRQQALLVDPGGRPARAALSDAMTVVVGN